MTIECPGAALCTGRAPEPDLPDHTGEAFHRVIKEPVAFLHQRSDAIRDRDKRNNDHRAWGVRR